MISSSDMDAYRSQVDRLADSASVSIRTYLDELIGDHDGREIDVAEIREATIAALDGILGVYATAAASAACDFMESHGMPPQTLADKDRDAIERTVRYQAGKLVDGDTEGFIEQVGNFARDAVVFSANHQQIKAAEAGRKHRRRHRGKGGGIRFARVPSGTETCAFCRMLASRGFAYWSRETAGELHHFHRGCDCRVVASDDPEGVEGYDPDREWTLWKRFEEIDADNSLSKVERDSAKRAALEAAAPHRPTLGGATRGKPMSFEEADSCHVNPKYGSEPGYSVNCQSCVVTFEARLRGYDVYTKANVKGSMLERLSYRTNLAWIDPETGKHPTYISSDANTPKRYVRFLNQAIGRDGERYTIQFAWKGKNNGGHIVNLDRTESGELRLKDNQRGPHEKSEWIGDREIKRYLSEVKFEMIRNKRKMNVGPLLLRVDNMEFDESVVNQIMAAVK